MVDIYDRLFSYMAEQIKWSLTNCNDDERDDLFADSENLREYMMDNGEFHEVVDGAVPIYTADIVETWLELDMPEAEDFAGDVGEQTGIIEQMMLGIYYALDDYAVRSFENCFNSVVDDLSKEAGNGTND